MLISNFKFKISNWERGFTLHHFNVFKQHKLKVEQSIKSMKSGAGFTLVELLSVMLVIVVVGSLIGIVLTFSLRGTKKTNSLNGVRENGNYALLQIAKMIEFAEGFEGVSTDGINYNSNCVQTLPPTPTPPPTPLQYSYVKITSFDGRQTVFSCLLPPSSPPTIASNGASLIDTDVVSLDSCWFTCTQERVVNVPIIGINFTLTKKTTSALTENQASVPFQTSATMRNLGK